MQGMDINSCPPPAFLPDIYYFMSFGAVTDRRRCRYVVCFHACVGKCPDVVHNDSQEGAWPDYICSEIFSIFIPIQL